MSLVENEDYYIDANGLLVFTSAYLLARGYCCGNGCRHCPYGGKDIKPQLNNPSKKLPKKNG